VDEGAAFDDLRLHRLRQHMTFDEWGILARLRAEADLAFREAEQLGTCQTAVPLPPPRLWR
jgi:hypothetical protein